MPSVGSCGRACVAAGIVDPDPGAVDRRAVEPAGARALFAGTYDGSVVLGGFVAAFVLLAVGLAVGIRRMQRAT